MAPVSGLSWNRGDLKYLLKVDEKGRITIPQSIRSALRLEPGSFIELVVDRSSRTITIRPISTGVMAVYRVRLNERRELVDLVSAVIEEGSELKYLECGETECSVGVLLVDVVIAEKLMEKLRSKGLEVIEYATR